MMGVSGYVVNRKRVGGYTIPNTELLKHSISHSYSLFPVNYTFSHPSLVTHHITIYSFPPTW